MSRRWAYSAKWGIGWGSQRATGHGGCAKSQQNWELAGVHYQQARALYEAIGDRYSLGRVLYVKGIGMRHKRIEKRHYHYMYRAISLWREIDLHGLAADIIEPRRQKVAAPARPNFGSVF